MMSSTVSWRGRGRARSSGMIGPPQPLADASERVLSACGHRPDRGPRFFPREIMPEPLEHPRGRCHIFERHGSPHSRKGCNRATLLLVRTRAWNPCRAPRASVGGGNGPSRQTVLAVRAGRSADTSASFVAPQFPAHGVTSRGIRQLVPVPRRPRRVPARHATCPFPALRRPSSGKTWRTGGRRGSLSCRFPRGRTGRE